MTSTLFTYKCFYNKTCCHSVISTFGVILVRWQLFHKLKELLLQLLCIQLLQQTSPTCHLKFCGYFGGVLTFSLIKGDASTTANYIASQLMSPLRDPTLKSFRALSSLRLPWGLILVRDTYHRKCKTSNSISMEVSARLMLWLIHRNLKAE